MLNTEHSLFADLNMTPSSILLFVIKSFQQHVQSLYTAKKTDVEMTSTSRGLHLKMLQATSQKLQILQWLTIENQNDPIYEVNDQFLTSWFEY